MATVVSLSPAPAALVQQWLVSQSGRADLAVVSVNDADADSFARALSEAEIALGDYSFQHAVDEAFLARAPRLRFIQQPSVGYQHIDLEACRRRNVLVSNTPGVNAAAVAEHTIMLALALLKQTVYANQKTRQGEWVQDELLWERRIFELAGKTWGIIGMGRIGREVARRLAPFDTKTVYFDAVRLSPELEQAHAVQYKPLDHLLRLADVASIHVPLSDATRGLIGEKELALMKFSALLVNVARGECVDEAALARRLREKKLAGAGIDVFSSEPIAADHPLLAVENVILTPHVAGVTAEVSQRVVQMAVANLVRVLRGEPPLDVINPSA